MDFRIFARGKKGEVAPEISASAAATLIAIIGISIVLYIVLIPPEARQEILGDKPYTALPGQESLSNEIVERELINKTLVLENIGEVDYIKQSEIEHSIPAMNLYTRTAGSAIREVNSLYMKNTLFSEEFKSIEFQLKDVHNTENVLLNFLVKEGSGRLIIKLNGFEIFNNEIDTINIRPIEISKDILRNDNVLDFEVENPSFLFWKVNEYSLEKITVTGDLTDVSKREASGLFYVEPEEKSNAEKVTLNFYPDCDVRKVGRIKVSLNQREIYTGIPDCNMLNKQEFPPEYLVTGNNVVSMFAESGDYYVDNIKVDVELEEPDNYIFYFNLDEDYFNALTSKDPICGEVDNICPDDCDADLDKDCCFEASSKNFWCDIATSETDDRCVGVVTYDRCKLCSSGYEEKDGDIAKSCKNLCGDDKDGICPIGCTNYVDKDCCHTKSTNYWCEDVPRETGVQGVCRDTVSQDECEYCPEGYKNKNGESPGCPSKSDTEIEDYKLKSKYDVDLNLKFVHDNEEKEGELIINSHKFFFDTRDNLYSRQLDQFLEPNFNSIQLIPKSSLNIVELEVKLKER
ncbi:MAG: hypothetical protein U9R08_07030 [Nanoarchaeota archaeon]|nr:hypothetical protein [Nanoarchaeota archaeon]